MHLVDLDDRDQVGGHRRAHRNKRDTVGMENCSYLYSAVSLTERGYAKAIEPRLHNYRADHSGPRRIIAMDYFEKPQGLLPHY
jgi:hypothetical protein